MSQETKKPAKKKSSWMKGFTLLPRNTEYLPDFKVNSKKLPPNTRDT